MAEERLPWFPCYPSKLLGALAGMRPDEGYVYWIVCLRIYEVNGPCLDSLDALARRSGMNRRRVSEALDLSFRSGRLVSQDGGIMNPFAEEVLADSKAIHKERVSAGSAGGKRAAENRKRKQQTTGSTAIAEPKQTGTHRQLQEQDSLFSDENRAPDLIDAKPESVAMKDPPLDPEADLYRRGKQILGPTAGGMIRNLLTAKGGNISLARAALELASTRGDAKQYIGAMVRGRGGTAGGGGNGFASLLRERRAQRENEGEIS